MNVQTVADDILKEAGLESHLERAMETLNFTRSEWELERKGGYNVLTVKGYGDKDYDGLIENLKPDFNTVYAPKYKGLIFREVKPLFQKTKY